MGYEPHGLDPYSLYSKNNLNYQEQRQEVQSPGKPNWMVEDKFGVLKAHGIVIPHYKGFPLAQWQDLMRKGPFDEGWEEEQLEREAAETQYQQEPESSEDGDESYVPPGQRR